MINPFRNSSLGIHQLIAAVIYPSIGQSHSTPRQRKGFFHRLINLGDVLHAASRNATININAAETIAVDPASDQVSNAIAVAAWDPLQNGHRLLQQGKLAEAVDHYRQAIQQDAINGEAYQYLAEALTQQGNLEEAAYCYRQAIALTQGELHPDVNSHGIPEISPQLPADCHDSNDLQSELAEDIPWFEQASFHLQQAIVNCNAGAWQEAEAGCQLAIETLAPEAFTAYLVLGRALQGQGQLTAAEQAYQKAIVLQPTSAETHARLGSLYADQQRLPEAIEQYQTAIQLNPQFAGAYWKLAEIWQQIGEEESAVSCCYQAFQLQPTWASPTDYCRLADRFLKLGKQSLAQDCYSRALHGNPKLAEAYFGIGTILQQQGSSTAIDFYRQAIQQEPQDSCLCANLGDALAQLEQWEDAQDCYQQLLQLVPDQLAGILGLQQCCMKLGQWQDALVYSHKRVDLQPHVAQAWHQLGDVLTQLCQWTEAIDAYQQAIDLDPNFSWSYNNLGDALLQLERWQEAISAYRAAISLHSEFVWSHYNLGEALAHLQNYDGAIDSYRTALKLDPNLPYASSRLADALQQRAANDYANALSCYQQAIQQNPHDPENYHKALELQPDAVELYLGLVEALMTQERLDEAIVCCQIARQLSPNDAEIIAKLKQILQQQEAVKRPRTVNQSDYDRWLQKHTPTPDQLQRMAETANHFAYRPLISILMPVYNPPVNFLKAAIQSVVEQVYPYWELCIADDASSEPEVRTLLSEYTAQDSRIKIVLRLENGHIAAASNSALALAEGDYVALLDHDDCLAPEALYEVVSLLNQHPEADMIYSDEDKLNQQEQRVHPFFKPDWCPDSFLSRMYTCHLGVYRRSLVETIGGFRLGYEGSQDYDLVLRLTEQTNHIFHLPKVLYHWRMHAASTATSQIIKTYAEEAAKQAIIDACERRGEAVRAVVTNPESPGVYTVRYQITDYKLVSIIIPTRNFGTLLDACLQSVFETSTYPNYEVILIDNGSDETETLQVINQWRQREPQRLKYHLLDIPFNYSEINNYAVSQAKGEYLLFLNNDIEVVTTDWIEAMVEQAQRPTIGAVGALLLYPDNTIQHAGVVLGIGGIAGHSHKYHPLSERGYFSQIMSVNNYSAVTAACLMCRREVFKQIGGFDETLAVAFNDVDLCLKMQQLGYQNVSLPHVVLYHHESKTRGAENTLAKRRRFQQELKVMQHRWSDLLKRDPCYSPHLTLEREDYSLRVE